MKMGEELYDHGNDEFEFKNLAGNKEYQNTINELKKYLPQKNAVWDANSSSSFQPYFVEQKTRINGEVKSTVQVIGSDR